LAIRFKPLQYIEIKTHLKKIEIMSKEEKLNANILKVTNTIRNEFPELLKFLNEMPETIPAVESPEINIQVLENYYESLRTILRRYAPDHGFLK
jgi:hypothetical protein